jgi:Novel STAND NTPase 1
VIRQLVAALVEVGVEVDAEAIADALWLALARRDESEDGDRQSAAALPPMPTEPRPPDAEPHPVGAARAASVHARDREPKQLARVSQVGSRSASAASSITLRRPRALPGALELGRALRPLKQRHPSKRNLALDAEATVEYFCDTGVLTPVMRPGAERWFDVDVLVDASPSMAVWQDTAVGLISLLERHGAFREVRHWALEQIDGEVRLSRAAGMRSGAPQLVAPDARRLIMVVTDCIGPMWYQAPIWDAIREWGLFSPSVITTMLPSRLWPRTALESPEIDMRSHGPGAANRSLDVTLPWWWPDDDPPQSSMPVPVITLEAGSVAAWARMVMGAGGVETLGVFATPPHKKATRSGEGPPDAEERVQRFRVTVSPVAYRLAVYLSAALRGRWGLALARFVQEAMLPESGQVHLAEVLVGGLVRRADRHTGDGEPMYEFADGVADVLQRSLTGTEALRVLQGLGMHIERETGRSPGIAAMLLGETAPEAAAEQFEDVRAGVANLIQAMGLARAEVIPRRATEARVERARNPYVGPRAFRVGEKLPAREREQRELTDLLIAERIVLLHSPAGAGKTSLIQAGVVPLLQNKHVGRTGSTESFNPLPLRVKTPPPADPTVHNRYVYSAALDLLRDHDPQELASLTFPEVLRRVRQQLSGPPVLIFDQFEEILTLDPADRDGQEVFFQELGSALADGDIWALFSMREDYLGGLDPFLQYLPDYLQVRYRLDFLDTSAAEAAIQEPAGDQAVTFTDEATESLLRRLTTVKVQRPGTGVEEIQAPYVVPFQLQVICRRLWKSLAEEKGDAFSSIDVDDIGSYDDISSSLRDYYADTVREVASQEEEEPLIREWEIRDWFERQLITEQHFRSQTQTNPVSREAYPGQVREALEDAFIIRSDTRAGATWYELSHDNLIEPILESNKMARQRPQPPSSV